MKLLCNTLLLALGLAFNPSTAWSWVEASFSQSIDPTLPTHLYIIGHDTRMGNLFFTQSLMRAEKLRSLRPLDQYVFLRARDYGDQRDLDNTTLHGVQILQENPDALENEFLADYILGYSQIKTIEFSAHSSWMGMSMGAKGRLSSLSALGDHLEKNGTYLNLQGCNAGYWLAPSFSGEANVPAFGALTGTDFQYLGSDGNWYFNNPGQFPDNIRWQWNRGLRWVRMRPADAPYRGGWGDYEDGWLNFTKAFCPPNKEPTTHCYPMLKEHVIRNQIESDLDYDLSFEEYKSAVKDMLCVSMSYSGHRNRCLAAIAQAEDGGTRVFHPMGVGNFAKCDEYSCEALPNNRSNRVDATPNPEPTTLIDEYFRYLEAYWH